MKRFLEIFYYYLFRFLLSLRYKIKIEGLEKLDKKNLSKPGGILFLANHPAEVDPCILLTTLWSNFRPHPVAIDYLFQIKGVRYFLDFVGALPVPHFEHSTNSFKKKQMERVYNKIYNLLQTKENVLIYPGGGLKRQNEEVLGGVSGVHTILQNTPDVNVVLVKTKGLWGSSFSRALTGRSPNIRKVFLNGFKNLLKNFLFFAPRRTVTVVIEPAPNDFPYQGTRLEVNRYLENWYNQEGPEPLTLVPYSFWKKELPEALLKNPSAEKIDLSLVPEETVNRVKEEISRLARRDVNEIDLNQDLAKDLGLDSLDLSQLLAFLKESFGVNNAHVTDIGKVEDVMALAARLKKGKAEDEGEEKKPDENWAKEENRPGPLPPQGKTIQEAFLRVTDRMDSFIACADSKFGEVSYKKLKLVVLLLAEKLRKLPGDRIGIMMPASVGANIVILATMMAKKVPVMINWTLGNRNLKVVIEESKIEHAISAWSFLDRLENVDLNGLDDRMLLLEEIFRSISLRDKIRTFFLLPKKAKKLLRAYHLDKVSPDDTAVILFTSGTENVPKAVPLTHTNILINHADAYKRADISKSDVFLGSLPPFHSFGFSITGLLPILVGLRVVFSPNPTDGRKLISVIEKWNATLLCIVPSFLKNLLRVATEKQFKSLRLIVTGAEKTPQEIYDKVAKLNPNAIVGEGYGITECGPILTLNPLNGIRRGVGLPLEHVEIRIVDPENYTPIAKNKDGLILARGPNVFNGYLGSRFSSPFVEIEGKKWYKTGDLGHLDEEGYLILSGRLKRFVKVGGEMISLAAIEEALVQAAPKKGWKIDHEASSLAVLSKEEEGKKGEIHLFATFPVTTDEVNEVLREHGMSNLSRISSVQKVPFIPILGTGKIDYKALAARL